jgi:bifunctional NMN adenylyltransferase/nudix hydrolase
VSGPTRYDTAVLIGRFQPFHSGHAALLGEALRIGNRVVLVLGSAHSSRTPRNPFTAVEREAMIRASLTESDNSRLHVVGQRDVWDARRWETEVRLAVERAGGGRTALVGYHKDSTSFYLDGFAGWDRIDTGRLGPLDATPLRESILSAHPASHVLSGLSSAIPGAAIEWLARWMEGPIRLELFQDLEAIRSYGRRHGSGPFVTVDAVVRALGHVLLITRGHRPGIGQMALPGGFLEPGESLESGALRELAEETGVAMDGVPVREAVFSHPARSQRARIVTHAFLYEPTWDVLPPVSGMDDAGSARWVRQDELCAMEDCFFEDHFHILDVFLGLVPGSEE